MTKPPQPMSACLLCRAFNTAPGGGPSFVNFRTEIDRWVEAGKAPDQTAAYWHDGKFQPTGSRRLRAYPKVAEYDG